MGDGERMRRAKPPPHAVVPRQQLPSYLRPLRGAAACMAALLVPAQRVQGGRVLELAHRVSARLPCRCHPLLVCQPFLLQPRQLLRGQLGLQVALQGSGRGS